MRSTSKIEWELALEERYKNMYQKISEENLKKLQAAYLDMFLKFQSECDLLNIKPFMVAGTLIGSVRHKGFIPWDDDIDLVVFREDYEKLKLAFKENREFDLVLPESDKKSIHKMLKVQSKTLTLYDVLGEGFSKNKFLYLDLLPIDYVPESMLVANLKGKVLKLMDLSYSSSRCYPRYSKHLDYMSKGSLELRINLFLRRIVGLPAILLGPDNLFKLMERLLCSTTKTSKITIAYGVKGYFGEIVDYDTFYPPKQYVFENHMFWGPNNAHKYLENRYGDYMQLPSEKEQKERHVRLRDDWEGRVIRN
ncbi:MULTISPECIES: LicD family protein [Streptococcus]|uniref:LicD family protein n=1 Tax=Streptococcus TaxID=1301 RepID=UPI0012DD95BB|nr:MULTISPECIES: LicD family protein [Streptococcus]QHF55058.1 LPS biosynthesis protein [Streptococcus sp. DAT741]